MPYSHRMTLLLAGALAGGIAACDDRECSGHFENACEAGEVVDVCCPSGISCNYGQFVTFNDDGTCRNNRPIAVDACVGDAEQGDGDEDAGICVR